MLPSQNAQAQTQHPKSRGQLIASGGGPGGPATACFTCHGIDGSGQSASGFPRIAGMDAQYLAKQLDDYASGTRSDDIMAPIARQLSKQDRRAVSLYYATLSLRAATEYRTNPDPALVQEGGALYALGSGGRNLQACINCHGPNARGLPPIFPALVGQPASYTAEQLRKWQSGRRSNSVGAVMEHIAMRLNEREIVAVAAYLANLRPDAKPQ